MNPESTHFNQIIKIKKIVVNEFVNPVTKHKWQDLYMISGIGSDYYRRKGILKNLADIIPDMDSYLYININSKDNWIDKLEMAFSISISRYPSLKR